MAYEIHVKNPTLPVNEVEIDGVKWTVNKTFANRRPTIFIVSGGAANG
jgi:hypothetical protein